MDFPIHIDTISMELSILCVWGSQVEFTKLWCISVLILANSADPDDMQHYAAFHLGLRCLTKYPFSSFQYTKG